MTPQEEARECARLLLAFADGESLQGFNGGRWVDYIHDQPPLIQYSEEWRIKPEPRKAWSVRNMFTEDKAEARRWAENGHSVTEWQEVIK